MNSGKFLSFLLIINFAFIEGDKNKNLKMLQELSNDIGDLSDEIKDLSDDKKELSGNKEILQDDKNKLIDEPVKIVRVKDIPLPKNYLIEFANYEFNENPYIINYDVIIRLASFSNNEVDNITMKVDIVTSSLNSLEVKEVTCIKKSEMIYKIFQFNCSEEVSGPVSKISFINNSLVLNEEIPLNLSISEIAYFFGRIIQNLPKNNYYDFEKGIIFFTNCSVYRENSTLLFKGETFGSKIKTTDSILYFVQDEDFKEIECNMSMSDEENKRFKMVCEPTFKVNATLSRNNRVFIKYLNQNGMMIFEEGKSLAFLEIEVNNINSKIKDNKISERKSKKIIYIIIILCIALLVIIITIIILCKCKPNSKAINQPPSVLDITKPKHARNNTSNTEL